MFLLLLSAVFVYGFNHTHWNCCNFSPRIQRLYHTSCISYGPLFWRMLVPYSPVYQQQAGKRSHRYWLALSDPYWATLCVSLCVCVCIKKNKNRQRDESLSFQWHWRGPNSHSVPSDQINLNSKKLKTCFVNTNLEHTSRDSHPLYKGLVLMLTLGFTYMTTSERASACFLQLERAALAWKTARHNIRLYGPLVNISSDYLQ